MQRLGIFVNVTNQFGTLTNNFRKGHRVNYEGYLAHFSEGFDRIIAIAYGTQVAEEANAFILALRHMGYTPKFAQATLVGRQDIVHPSRNVEMTLDILQVYERLDVIVVGSNDPELIPLINFLKMRGIKVIVATPIPVHSEGTSNIDICTITDLVVNIQDMRSKKPTNKKTLGESHAPQEGPKSEDHQQEHQQAPS